MNDPLHDALVAVFVDAYENLAERENAVIGYAADVVEAYQAKLNASAAPISQSDVIAAAIDVVDAYTAEAEDWNDGEFALWRKEDLVNAIVKLRQALGR